MSFLTPFFLLLGLLAGPIILLYMLRLRRRELLVSSTMLWQKLLRDREANAPWQRLRRNLLLLLQLLILAALVLALARPFIPVPSIVSGSVVVLLDASASMQATDSEPTRFAAAKAEVNRLINDLDGRSQMTIIRVGHEPAVLASASSDKTQLRATLAQAQPDAAAADWHAAFALAAGAAQGFRNARIVVVSDGGLPPDLSPLPAELAYVPIGDSGENLAITALATRNTGVGRNTDAGPQLFAGVRNYGAVDQEALLSISLDGTLFDSRRLAIPAGGSASATWDLPESTAVIEARLSNLEADILPLDNTAWAVHEGGVSNRVLLITEGNLFLEQVFSVLPGVEAFKAHPGSGLLEEPFDLLIFDGVSLPSPLPAADMLIINPQPDGTAATAPDQLFSVTGAFTNTVTVRLDDSPLLQFVEWRNVHIRQAQAVTSPWAQPLVTAEGGPLILAGERGGHRFVIITFDLRQSDLPLQIAFPVLVANITSWLSPGRAFDAPTGLQPGDSVSITPGAATIVVTVQKPDGRLWTADVSKDALLFTETDQLGVYHVILRDSSGEQPTGSFAVNLFDPGESQVAPANSIKAGERSVDTAAGEDIGQRELWPWLIAAAFAVLLVEWWVHHRGAQLPSFPRIR
ncbi:MAG: VWA domain-containing protein [Anaerolineae bacterium]